MRGAVELDTALLRVLRFLCSTPTKVVDELLLETLLKLDRVTVGKTLGVLLADGYLSEVEVEGLTTCSNCPLSRLCPAGSFTKGGVKMYVPTERLRKLCREFQNVGLP